MSSSPKKQKILQKGQSVYEKREKNQKYEPTERAVDEILAVRNLNEDVEHMNFEIKVRQLMRDLIEPLINKGKTDREMIFRIEKAEEGYAKRIDMLEKAVYKKDDDGQPTLFAEMEAKILQMQVDLKVTFNAVQTQIEATEQKLFDQMFLLDSRVLKIENYKDQLDNNRAAIVSLQKVVEETFQSLRGSVEKNLHRAITEANRLDKRIHGITKMCDDLPRKMVECETMCIEANKLSVALKESTQEVINNSFSLDAKKLSIEEQEQYAARVQRQLHELEKQHDENENRTKELQNWIDIYMPLRFQHQLQETMKECLPRKGRYLLSVVSTEMCSQLRERMFNDVNEPLMLDRCLYVIQELKMEADILAKENKRVVTDAADNYAAIDPEAEKAAENPVLAKLDMQGNLAGDADSEALGKLQEELTEALETGLTGLRTEFLHKLKSLNATIDKQFTELSQAQKASHDSLAAFQTTLKEDLDYSTENNKMQQGDNLTMIKKIATTLAKMKESEKHYSETEQRIKDTLRLIVQHQTQLHQAVNQVLGLSTEEMTDPYKEKLLASTTGRRSQISAGRGNTKQPTIVLLGQEPENQEGTVMRGPDEALKRLNLAMYRNRISGPGNADTAKSTATPLTLSTRVKKHSIISKIEGAQFSTNSLNVYKAQTVGSMPKKIHIASHQGSEGPNNLENMGDLETFLRDNKSDASLGRQSIPSPMKPLQNGHIEIEQDSIDSTFVPGAQALASREQSKPMSPNLERRTLSQMKPHGGKKQIFGHQKHNSIVDFGQSDRNTRTYGVNFLKHPIKDDHRNLAQSALSRYDKRNGQKRQMVSQSITLQGGSILKQMKYSSQERISKGQQTATTRASGVFKGTKMFPAILPGIVDK